MATMASGSVLFSSLHVSETAQIGGTYTPPFATRTTYGTQSTAAATITGARNPNPTTPAFTSDWQWINSYLTIHKMSTPSYRYSYILWLVVVLFVVIFAILHYTGSRGGAIGASWSKWSLRRRTWRKKSTLAAIHKSNQPHRQPWSLPSNAQILSLVVLFIVPIILCTIGPDYIAPGTRVWDLTHNVTKRGWEDPVAFFKRAGVASTATTRSPAFTIQHQWWTAGGRTGIIAFALFPLAVLFSLKSPPFALLALPFTIQLHFDKLARLHRWVGRLVWFITTVHVGTWLVQLLRDHRHGHAKMAVAFVWVYKPFVHGAVAYVALTLLTLLSIGPIRTRYYELFYICHVILVPVTLVESALHFPPIWWWCWAPLILWVVERGYRFINYLIVNGILFNPKNNATAFVYPEEDVGGEKYSYPNSNGYAPANAPQAASRRAEQPESWEMTGIRDPRSMDSRQTEMSPEVDVGTLDGRSRRVMSGESFTESITSYYGAPDANRAAGATPRPRPKTGEGYPADHRFSGGTDDVHRHLVQGDSGWVDYESQFRQQLDQVNKVPKGQSAYAALPNPPAPQRSAHPTGRHLLPRASSTNNFHTMYPPSPISATNPGINSRLPPPGFARAQILPGRTIRLSLATPRRFSWAPGQHVLLNIPEISKFSSHPFTIASVSDSAIAGAEGREVVLLIRAKNGFTKELWHELQKRRAESKAFDGTASLPEKKHGKSHTTSQSSDRLDGSTSGHSLNKSNGRSGTVMRAYVDGPFGSTVRARWSQHSSVLIVCGGSGVSFGLAILEYLCLCMTGRDGKSLGGKGGGFGKDSFCTRRVRFVWLIREYSHIQWCATVIRRCLDMVPNPNMLQIDIFVTNFAHKSTPLSQDLSSMYLSGASVDTFGAMDYQMKTGEQSLAPPAPRFAKEGRRRSLSTASMDSMDSNASVTSLVDLSYADGGNSPVGDSRGNPRHGGGGMNDLEHEEHVLDLTNFDGEDDTRLPGEAQLSLKVKKEGRIRRAKSRKVASAAAAKADLAYKSAQMQQDPSMAVSPSSYRSPVVADRGRGVALFDPPASSVPLYPPSSDNAPRGPTPTSPTNTYFPSSDDHYTTATTTTAVTPQSAFPPRLVELRGISYQSNRLSVAESIQSRFGDRNPSPAPSGAALLENTFDSKTLGGGESVRNMYALNGGTGANMGDFVFDIDEDEVEDLNVVSEMARPGKPRLDRILSDEVERAKGAVAVACCGPTSLNALIRKLVAAKIDPARIRKGDMRGQITLISEDFEW